MGQRKDTTAPPPVLPQEGFTEHLSSTRVESTFNKLLEVLQSKALLHTETAILPADFRCGKKHFTMLDEL